MWIFSEFCNFFSILASTFFFICNNEISTLLPDFLTVIPKLWLYINFWSNLLITFYHYYGKLIFAMFLMNRGWAYILLLNVIKGFTKIICCSKKLVNHLFVVISNQFIESLEITLFFSELVYISTFLFSYLKKWTQSHNFWISQFS